MVHLRYGVLLLVLLGMTPAGYPGPTNSFDSIYFFHMLVTEAPVPTWACFPHNVYIVHRSVWLFSLIAFFLFPFLSNVMAFFLPLSGLADFLANQLYTKLITSGHSSSSR
jgi:hypothetical protein